MLGLVGSEAGEAIPPLIAMLTEDEDAGTRNNAAVALGWIGRSTHGLFPGIEQGLVRALRDQRFRCASVRNTCSPAPATGAGYGQIRRAHFLWRWCAPDVFVRAAATLTRRMIPAGSGSGVELEAEEGRASAAGTRAARACRGASPAAPASGPRPRARRRRAGSPPRRRDHPSGLPSASSSRTRTAPRVARALTVSRPPGRRNGRVTSRPSSAGRGQGQVAVALHPGEADLPLGRRRDLVAAGVAAVVEEHLVAHRHGRADPGHGVVPGCRARGCGPGTARGGGCQVTPSRLVASTE